MKEREKKIFEKNGVLDKVYGQEVSRLIRERYSLDEEFAISRQRDTKPEEWAEFNAYCEQCKAEAKITIYGGSTTWI